MIYITVYLVVGFFIATAVMTHRVYGIRKRKGTLMVKPFFDAFFILMLLYPYSLPQVLLPKEISFRKDQK